MADVTLKHVSKIYDGGVRAVADVNVEIKDGEFIILVGPSGCGKSTLLRMVAGLEEISEGELVIDNRVVNHVSAKDRDIAMVFQNYALYPHMSVYENMAFGLKMRKFPKEETDKRVRAAAEILGLTKYLERKPKALSGGQRQRVAVGRAIVRQPKLFLFDEPLSNLDAALRVGMRTELIKLHQRLAATMIYVTHDQTEAMSMGDRLIVLKDGVVQQIGKPLEVYHRPVNRFVAGFLGSPPMNFIDGELSERGGEVSFTNGALSVRLPEAKRAALDRAKVAARRVTLGVRPEDVLERKFYAGPTPHNVVRAQVEFIEPLGSEVLATCSINGREIIARLSPRTEAASGEPIELVFETERAKLFDAATGEAMG
jgi:multiple sugar transport system ATP-binding protein